MYTTEHRYRLPLTEFPYVGLPRVSKIPCPHPDKGRRESGEETTMQGRVKGNSWDRPYWRHITIESPVSLNNLVSTTYDLLLGLHLYGSWSGHSIPHSLVSIRTLSPSYNVYTSRMSCRLLLLRALLTSTLKIGNFAPTSLPIIG